VQTHPSPDTDACLSISDRYQYNRKLNKTEYALRRLYLNSMPRYMTIVIGNKCNINCRHCYQVKNGDSIFENPKIESHLRREFLSMYPYLSTLRLQGGEPFFIKGFKELVDDVSSVVDRPIISVSTNGTLIDDAWAEKVVKIPFQSITFSIDAGTHETYAKIRRGSDLNLVTQNIIKIQAWKTKLNSEYPDMDSSFVIMRSNFREIPDFVRLAKKLHIRRIALQTILVDARNLTREPDLKDEIISDANEVMELHQILCDLFKNQSAFFDSINVSGLNSLFEKYHLDNALFDEENNSWYPDNESDGRNPENPEKAVEREPEQSPKPDQKIKVKPRTDAPPDIELCPNPWTLIFVTENGAVSICFCAQPIGNIYAMPLVSIWNSPQAIGFRSNLVNGRYIKAGCSELWCSWREGRQCTFASDQGAAALKREFRDLVNCAISNDYPSSDIKNIPSHLTSIRRAFAEKEQRIQELHASLVDLCGKNQSMLDELDRQRMDLEHRLNNSISNSKSDSLPAVVHEYYKIIFIEISKFKLKTTLNLIRIHAEVFVRGFRNLKHKLKGRR